MLTAGTMFEMILLMIIINNGLINETSMCKTCGTNYINVIYYCTVDNYI